MRVLMSYGKTGLAVELDDAWDVTVIERKPMPGLPDPSVAVCQALESPVGSQSLAEAAAGARRACILVCDITRPVPNGTILPPLVRTMLDAGMRPEDITVLVATGLHRPNEGDELAEVVGDPWVLETARVENHFARNDEDHADLGTTRRGTPVKLDRRFVEADLRVAVGLVEPHFMAGYSGGRKMLAPGIAHADTITTLHNAAFMGHPNAASGVLDGNPLHEEQMEILVMAGGALGVNVAVNERRELSYVSFGEIGASHRQAVEFVRAHVEAPVGRKFGTVLTSAAGYPLDRTYYQTVKGMVGAMDILRPGGDAFVVSECSEGLGSPEYRAAQERLVRMSGKRFLAELHSKPRAGIDEWQTQMQLKPMEVGSLHLYSGMLAAEDAALTGVATVASLPEALRRSVERSGDGAVAVIPEGPYVMPRYVGPVSGPVAGQ